MAAVTRLDVDIEMYYQYVHHQFATLIQMTRLIYLEWFMFITVSPANKHYSKKLKSLENLNANTEGHSCFYYLPFQANCIIQ